MNDLLVDQMVKTLEEVRVGALALRAREAQIIEGKMVGDPRAAALVVTHVEDAILRLRTLGQFSA